jgi:hypothetical protein
MRPGTQLVDIYIEMRKRKQRDWAKQLHVQTPRGAKWKKYCEKCKKEEAEEAARQAEIAEYEAIKGLRARLCYSACFLEHLNLFVAFNYFDFVTVSFL